MPQDGNYDPLMPPPPPIVITQYWVKNHYQILKDLEISLQFCKHAVPMHKMCHQCLFGVAVGA